MVRRDKATCVLLITLLVLSSHAEVLVLGQGGTGRPTTTSAGKKTERVPRTASGIPKRKANAERMAASTRAASAKDYLVNTHGISSDRLVTLEGGRRETQTVELWVVPTGAVPPIPSPPYALSRLSPDRVNLHHAVNKMEIAPHLLNDHPDSEFVGWGQLTDTFPSNAFAQSACNEQNRRMWYDTFIRNRVMHQELAYEAAMQYLNACPERQDPDIPFLRKWASAYERGESRRMQSVCPTSVEVRCPSGLRAAGEGLTFTGSFQSSSNELLTYNWTVSAGTITSGQGTDSINVDTTGLSGRSVTATMTLGGLDPLCMRAASCTATMKPPPMSIKFDEYRDLSPNDEKVRLDNFAARLRGDPTAQGYIIVYRSRFER